MDSVQYEEPGDLIEGVLRCTQCLREYPVIDGIPMLVPTIRHHVQHNAAAILYRDDLSPTVESILGDCLGPGSEFDTLRQHLSNYCSDHWGDLDPGSDPAERTASAAICRVLDQMVGLDAAGLQSGRILDLGCSVGRWDGLSVVSRSSAQSVH